MQGTGSPWTWRGGDVEVELAALRLAGRPLSQQDQRDRARAEAPPKADCKALASSAQARLSRFSRPPSECWCPEMTRSC